MNNLLSKTVQKGQLLLYAHQHDAIERAMSGDGSIALFHEPGLGKTRTCLEIYRRLRREDPALKLIVVCPLSLVHAAWGADIEKFTQFTYQWLKAPQRTMPDITVVHYELLLSQKYLLQLEKIIQENLCMCVVDESSRMKNHKSMTTKTLLSLAPYFKYRVIASGTPMPNSEVELWGQMEFLERGLLGKSFYAFRNTYFHLERLGEQRVMPARFMTRQMMREIMRQGWCYRITPQKRALLMHLIKPLTHWVKKSEALDLPGKINQIREVVLNAQERTAYEEMKRFLITEIKGEEIAVQAALAKIMKLRQASSGFFYGQKGDVVTVCSVSSKLKELEDLLEELGNQQVILWCQFHEEIAQIEAMISKKYGPDMYATLYAETKDKDCSIDAFKTGKVRYLIAHPKSASHGLTFINCSTMIFYSLDYSYEAHSQARDRIHRIGQTKSCLYIYLLAKDTIDEDLIKVLQHKQDVQESVYALIRKYTHAESNSVDS